MKKILPIIFLLIANNILCQTVSIRVLETAFSATDPDAGGPATGSITIRFDLMASADILADGMGLSFVYQSNMLMPTPTNTTTALGPVASSAGWSQNVDNRTGSPVTVNYGGQAFDQRMIITFQQSTGLDNLSLSAGVWTPVAEVTYWTKGVAIPEGGYATPEPGSILPQNTLSADGGLTSYDYLSANLNTPIPLTSVLPVLFTKFEAGCTNNGATVSWSTGSEFNSNYFELQRSANGNNWTSVSTIKAAGNSSTGRTYKQTDVNNGPAYYRIRQVDIDGNSSYTSIIRTNCELKKIDMVIYPVPAQDILNVVITSDRSIKTHLYIIDGIGKIVRRTDATLFNGSNTFLFNLKGLASGEYIIRSNDPGVELHKKFNIIR